MLLSSVAKRDNSIIVQPKEEQVEPESVPSAPVDAEEPLSAPSSAAPESEPAVEISLEEEEEMRELMALSERAGASTNRCG